MNARFLRVVLLAASLAPSGYGQFKLFVVNGGTESQAPAVYDFGPAYPNQAVSTQFRVQNISTAAATVSYLALAGAGFTLNQPTLPVTLAPQATFDFTVSFLGTGAGSYSAGLTLSGYSVILTASVVPWLTYEVNTAAGLQPLGTAPVDFGSVQLGSSAALHFVAVNQTTVVLTVPAISVAGGDFVLSGVAPSGTLLQPNQSAAFDVRFTPAAAGSRTGSLVIGTHPPYVLAGTGAQLTYEVDSGAGLQPLGAGPVDFGSVQLGFTSSRHFAVANQSAVVLTVPAIAVPSGDFALSGAAPSGTSLQPGQSAAFDVRFSPTAAAARTGSLVIGNQTYALAGTGAQLTYEVDSGAGLQSLGAGPVDFGSVQLGFTASRHFAVVNQTAVVLMAPVTAVPPGDFALTGVAPSGTLLQPGQSAGFDVRFTPTAAGPRTGSLVIGNQTCVLVGTGAQLTYEVDSGAGLQPLGAGPVDFGSVQLGLTASRHFAVANQSAVVLTAPAIAVPPGDFTLTGVAPGGLALQPGQSADFYVQFTPTAAGARSGSLVIGGQTYVLAGTGAQLSYEVDAGAGLQPLGASPVDFGSVQLGLTASRHFAVANQSAVVLTVPAITVPSGDFTLTGATPGGLALPPGQSADFYIQFTPTAGGARTGSLVVGGQTYALVGTGAQLTYEADSGAGLQPLGAGPVDFGSVERGVSVIRHFAVANQTAVVLTVPAIAVPAGDFALTGAVPAGLALPPGQSADFHIQFTPTATGARTGSLAIGNQTYGLTGTGVEPPLPNPGLKISPSPQALSAQPGAVTVTLDATSRTSGSGTLTLDFQPAPGLTDDAAIVFASGGRTAAFTVSPGDAGDQFTVSFQTGSTAGALVFTVQLGGVTNQQTIAILPASVGITSFQGVRSAAGIQVQVTGFDNTRTAGLLTFTFFDAAGNTVAPGAIRTDATATFASYFQNSSLGGVFLLTAVFPVTGDPSQIGAFQIQIANSVGATQTARTVF